MRLPRRLLAVNFSFLGEALPYCVLAIDAVTGRLRWHYQTLHHDLWDRDLPAPPNLVTLEREGKKIDAVAQITKLGVVFVLDRDTGEPLFPVEERPVPPSDLEGEEAWPTQPFPLKPPPFSRLSFTEADVTDLSPRAHQAVMERFRQVRSGHIFEPPSTQGTLVFPGFNQFKDPDGYPAIKPPWGQLTAIDLNAGTISWQVTLGL